MKTNKKVEYEFYKPEDYDLPELRKRHIHTIYDSETNTYFLWGKRENIIDYIENYVGLEYLENYEKEID